MDALNSYMLEQQASSEREAFHAQLCAELRENKSSVLALVRELGEFLAGEDNVQRSKCTKLLAQVIESVPEVLTAHDVHHLACFLAARLADWPCLEGAAAGCRHLLRRRSASAAAAAAPLARLTSDDAAMIAKSVRDNVQVQAMSQADRNSCLQLLLALMEEYGADVAVGGLDVADMVLVAVDGEKDPRCLLLAFKCVQVCVSCYHAPGVEAGPLAAVAAELADVLAAYFPVTFTPPKNDTHRITREDLARALQATMAATPFFAEHLTPVIIEKLTSTYRPAKQDALDTLVACAAGWGGAALERHVNQLWQALRAELLAPALLGMSGDDLVQANSLADAAARALAACCRAGAAAALAALVLNDAAGQDLLVLLRRSSSADESSDESAAALGNQAERQALCWGRIWGAVAAAAPAPCQTILAATLTALLDTAAAFHQKAAVDASAAAMRAPLLALAALHHMVMPMAEAAASDGWEAAAAPPAWSGGGCAHMVGVLERVYDAAAAVLEGAGEDPCSDTAEAAVQLQLCCLALAQDLVTCPASLLGADLAVGALRLMMRAVLAPPSGGGGQCSSEEFDVCVWWGRPGSVRGEGLRGLSLVLEGQGGQVQLLKEGMTQQVLAAVEACCGADDSPPGALADTLEVACHMARCDPAAATALVVRLLVVARQQLEAGRVSALLTLLTALGSGLAPHLSGPLPAQDSWATAELVQQVLTQLPALRPLPPAPLMADAAHSLAALTAACSADQQQGLALSACEVVVVAAAAHRTPPPCPPPPASTSFSQLLATSVLGALRPGVLSAPSTALLTQALAASALLSISAPAAATGPGTAAVGDASTATAITDESSTVLAAAAARSCAAALGSVLNKWAEPASLEAMVQGALAQLDESWAGGGASERLATLHTHALLVRALTQRAHPSWAAALATLSQRVLSCAAQPPPSCTSTTATTAATATGNELDASVSGKHLGREAAVQLDGAVGAACAGDSSGGGGGGAVRACACLGLVVASEARNVVLWRHVQARPLWQQRTFAAALRQVSEAVKAGAASEQLPSQLLAFAFLVASAPPPAYCSQASVVAEHLPACLALLARHPALARTSMTGATQPPHTSQAPAPPPSAAASHSAQASTGGGTGGDGDGDGLLLLRVLCVVEKFVREEALRVHLHERVEEVVGALCRLVLACPSAACRCAAVQLLADLLALPYHLLHPHRTQVVKALERALDDDRRCVRQAAVKCRRVWTLT